MATRSGRLLPVLGAASRFAITSGGLPTQLIVTTTTRTTLQAHNGEHVIKCSETETGRPLSAALTRKLAHETTVMPATLSATGIPLDIAHATRTIPSEGLVVMRRKSRSKRLSTDLWRLAQRSPAGARMGSRLTASVWDVPSPPTDGRTA